MEKVHLKDLAAHISQDVRSEYKFLITRDGNIFISSDPVDRLTTLIHKDWLAELQRRGEITSNETEETVVGGYIKNEDGELMYWGKSTTPIKGATEQELFDALEKSGAILTSARRRE